MNFKRQLIFGTLTILFTSCIAINKQVVVHKAQDRGHTLGGKLFSSAWMQRSAEYKALCWQSYLLAKLRLDEALSLQHSKPLAIVTDIDETMIDNSPYSVHRALKGEDYSDKSWDEWCTRQEASALAGALEFFRYADDKGVKIFYISNRNEATRIATIGNLKKLGFPQLSDSQLLLRTTSSDKTERRRLVAEQYDIVLLLGDNLGDFDHIFDSADESLRLQGFKEQKEYFGTRFIVLPNPNYGNWEKAFYGGYPSLEEKDRKLQTQLKRY